MLANDRVRGLLRRVLPASAVNLYWRLQRRANRRRSVRDVFTDVYERNLWGGAAGEYCSGAGSDEARAEAYAEVVRAFMKGHDVRSVVDLGCGDFNVGRKLLVPGVQYTGVDVVEGLIERNQAMHGGPEVRFLCIDATSEELPDADLCLIRQVLQHLSNQQIQAVLERTRKFRYVLVTEHYPAPDREGAPNRDKPHGADTRIIDDSAVYLDRPPFDREVSDLVLEVDAGYWLRHPGETLRTYLLENH